jgi:type I restriction enzyme S subunit
MSKENKLIPELRFPEFEKDGEWVENELDHFCFNISSGKDKVSEAGEFPLYGSTGIIGKTDNISYTGDYILVARVGANAGFLNRAKGKFGVTDNTLVLDLKNSDKIDFIYFSLNKIGLNKLVFGSGQPLITAGQLKSLQLVWPKSGKEQQKIASCLSSLDEIIATHSQKLNLLKDHKKGMMQNLFPQEGEKVPKYRFREFEKDGEWVEKTLIDTADKNVKWSFTGGPFGSNLMASDYKESGFRIIQLQNIGDGVFNDDNKIYASIEKADELLSCNIYASDIIISKMGDPVGRACIIPDTLHRSIMASDGIRLVVDETKYSKYFIYSLINSKRIRGAIEKKATGSTRKRIGLDTLREIELIVPNSPKEQQKIAYCLSSLDALITAQAEKIEQLKLHKKGLMQGLFPKINE